MGKNKKSFDMYQSYLDSLPASSGKNAGYEIENVPLPDSMRTSTLIEQIGKERSWTEDQIDSDIDILEANRLGFVRDLRDLSDNSWKVIPLLPLVRDLLRAAVSPKYQKKKKNKSYKKKSDSSDSSEDENNSHATVPTKDSTIDPTTNNGGGGPDAAGPTPETSPGSKKVFSGRPIEPVNGNRIRVKTTDGVYECNRFCPHKGVDLVTWGNVLGNTLVCTKHNWRFNLEGNEMVKGKSLNACKVNDW
ncbi:hypothetical protein J3Q64DRAFT_1811798 [Phycomyces blakesleeanus]|uniref:Rieske domain-containing protein n=2 Tax=Phycomyces blakesleeanus TaxID=4837 RepID=A0A167LAD8_PHYB8|nr:hypothetical protein PHYBLDRAFT_182697 [Phycomyces blakesleeanus NRRL 1555(-)]OAD69979.1 hypothetical protein PHYBLDRAFT_182697 [Phycomyces blakesleeanus NRRL 1555(-)]|eukprot:XP_018288019.1 hypothetical protein PHYBLDRAFT_182697 [Phycomyces blakesleeanus NRRL 1555(-)]